MYAGLIVRDECERLVKNQVSKEESVKFATSLREATCKKATYEAHDWKLRSHIRLLSSRVFRKEGHPTKYSQNILFGKKSSYFTKFFTHTIYTLITHKLWEVLFREKTLENTLER